MVYTLASWLIPRFCCVILSILAHQKGWNPCSLLMWAITWSLEGVAWWWIHLGISIWPCDPVYWWHWVEGVSPYFHLLSWLSWKVRFSIKSIIHCCSPPTVGYPWQQFVIRDYSLVLAVSSTETIYKTWAYHRMTPSNLSLSGPIKWRRLHLLAKPYMHWAIQFVV
jgi:hypothetical protein